jgi:nuclear cap-binding protein subunit 1
VTPDLRTIAGYTIRSCLTDTIHIFEVNRKDCARILLEFDRWTIAGTFRPKPGTPAKEGTEDRPGWQLENTVMETIFDMLTVLPYAARQLKNVYYAALIAELCKLSPSTTGPALGKSIRHFYSLLGGTEDADSGGALDVELSRRIAEWFAMHMSNFNFQWVWKEWYHYMRLSHAYIY